MIEYSDKANAFWVNFANGLSVSRPYQSVVEFELNDILLAEIHKYIFTMT